MPSLSDIIPASHSCVAHPYATGHYGSNEKFEQGNMSLTI